jgi:hypothetical protein
MGKPLTYMKAQELQLNLFPRALSRPGALYVLSHLTEKDMTTNEIRKLLPADKMYGVDVFRTMFYLMMEGLVDSEALSLEDTKWGISDYGRKIEELAREMAETMKKSAEYREKNLPQLQFFPRSK